jgi:hypothetical protein
MKSTRILVAILWSAIAGMAQAAVSEDEAKQLGATLTPFGAEKAGNKDGSIPPYTGGLTAPPGNYQKGNGWRPDPFPEDKPLFSINAKNMDKYADKLTAGAKELMKKYPDFRIDVYPTRRTVAYPPHVLDNTVKNATRCKTYEGGLALEEVCKGGVPFPIPKSGHEAMWNHMVGHGAFAKEGKSQTWFVDSSGRASLGTEVVSWVEIPYYDPDPQQKREDVYFRYRVEQIAPARQAGINSIISDQLNPVQTARRAWVYMPGQRRVRVAPDFAYDTPVDGLGGVMNFDMVNIFTGKMDRFDFRLVGKQEVYMPYNNYKPTFQVKPEDTLGPNYVKPENMRWELHRAWVVEATVKPGKRHAFQKWVFYWDEDNALFGMSDAWDAGGKLYKSSYTLNTQLYESMASNADPTIIYDFANSAYVLTAIPSPGSAGLLISQRRPSSYYSPEALAGAGVR